jgi:hypothetical protein
VQSFGCQPDVSGIKARLYLLGEENKASESSLQFLYFGASHIKKHATEENQASVVISHPHHLLQDCIHEKCRKQKKM